MCCFKTTKKKKKLLHIEKFQQHLHTFFVENSHTAFYTIVENEMRYKMVTRMSIPIINQARNKKKKKSESKKFNERGDAVYRHSTKFVAMKFMEFRRSRPKSLRMAWRFGILLIAERGSCADNAV